MKRKLLKYNLIVMTVFFAFSMLYNAGAFLNSLIIEIRFRSGDFAYKTTGLSGDFLQELYSEEWSMGYMIFAFLTLSVIAVVTILFYQKILSKIPFLLLFMSAFAATQFGIAFSFDNPFALAFILIVELIYTALTVFFTLRDFKRIQTGQNDGFAAEV